MLALLCFVLAVLASPFKSKIRLEAENAAVYTENRRCQSKILNTWSGHRTAQIDPEKCMKINGREIRF